MSDAALWTRADYNKLKAAYAEARKQKKEIFKFDGHDVLTVHIEALLGILAKRFKDRS